MGILWPSRIAQGVATVSTVSSVKRELWEQSGTSVFVVLRRSNTNPIMSPACPPIMRPPYCGPSRCNTSITEACVNDRWSSSDRMR